MIGTPAGPLENLVRVRGVDAPRIVAGEDGREVAEEALAHEPAAVWVGGTCSPAFEEFCTEVGRPAP
jgi:hypothetical protein